MSTYEQYTVRCKACNNGFLTAASNKTHCSPECRVRTAAAPFAGSAGCWVWPGSLNPQTGYGQLSEWIDGKRFLRTAHRTSYAAFKGEPMKGQHVLHQCDNPACFNPDHLFAGTHRQNMEDMAQKGRAHKVSARGEAHGMSRFTAEDAIAIRTSSDSVATLMARYGMSKSNVWAIKKGRLWAHV